MREAVLQGQDRFWRRLVAFKAAVDRTPVPLRALLYVVGYGAAVVIGIPLVASVIAIVLCAVIFGPLLVMGWVAEASGLAAAYPVATFVVAGWLTLCWCGFLIVAQVSLCGDYDAWGEGSPASHKLSKHWPFIVPIEAEDRRRA